MPLKPLVEKWLKISFMSSSLASTALTFSLQQAASCAALSVTGRLPLVRKLTLGYRDLLQSINYLNLDVFTARSSIDKSVGLHF